MPVHLHFAYSSFHKGSVEGLGQAPDGLQSQI